MRVFLTTRTVHALFVPYASSGQIGSAVSFPPEIDEIHETTKINHSTSEHGRKKTVARSKVERGDNTSRIFPNLIRNPSVLDF